MYVKEIAKEQIKIIKKRKAFVKQYLWVLMDKSELWPNATANTAEHLRHSTQAYGLSNIRKRAWLTTARAGIPHPLSHYFTPPAKLFMKHKSIHAIPPLKTPGLI